MGESSQKRGQRRKWRWPVEALRYALNVVCALLSEDCRAWAVRSAFAVSERWPLGLPYTTEGLGVKYSALPGVPVAARSAHATGTRAGQLAHHSDALGLTAAYSAHAVCSPVAAVSRCANSAAGSTFSSNECRTAGSHSSGYCSSYYSSDCSSYCSGYCSSDDLRSVVYPSYCSAWANSPDDRLGSSPATRSDFRRNYFRTADWPLRPRIAPAGATLLEHGKRLQQPWRKLHRSESRRGAQ
jgi:hypothetical protein